MNAQMNQIIGFFNMHYLLKDSQIISHSFNSNGVCLYEVKWGNGDITWEPLNIAQGLTSFVDYPYRPQKTMFK